MAPRQDRVALAGGAAARPARPFLPPRVTRIATPYPFLLPALLALLLIYFYPMLRAVVVSLQSYDELTQGFTFIGLDNYAQLVQDPEVWNSLGRSAIWVAGSVLGQFLVGFGFALLLNERWPGNRIMRALILMPWVMPGVSIAIGWSMIYNPMFGMLNDLLARFGLPTQTWLADPSKALLAVILPNIWKAFPFVAVTMLAGLAAIPAELYEAAKVDGATVWDRFRYVTLPALRNLIVILTLLLSVWTFNFFDLPFVLTNGGPANATEIMPILVYRAAFANFQYGYASALAVVMTVINIVFAVFYLRRSLRREA
jgi:multiple sugar transport system permease protein